MVKTKLYYAIVASLLAAFIVLAASPAATVVAQLLGLEDMAKQSLGSMEFHKTLHATTKGMKYWYDLGLGKQTGVAYEELFCKKCHATCETCHAKKDATGKLVGYTKRISMDTCLSCHGREKKALMLAAAGKIPGDIHMVGHGYTCTYCHPASEVHGVGSNAAVMRELVSTDCNSCHGAGRAIPAFKAIPEHRQHLKDLHCTACHVPTVVSCYNCHFDLAYKSYTSIGKVIKKAYPVLGWLLLVHDNNRGGKIHSGNIMVVVWKEKNAYRVDITPQFPHIVVREGRHCEDCHATQNVLKILETKEFTLTWWNEKEGKLAAAKGIIPIVEDVTYKIQLIEYDQAHGVWKPYKIVSFKPKDVLINNASPLTWSELEKLAKPETR